MVKLYEESRFEKLQKVLENTYDSEGISKLVDGLCALGNALQLINLYTANYNKFKDGDRLKIIVEICQKGNFEELRQFLESSGYMGEERNQIITEKMRIKGTFDELTDFLSDTTAYLSNNEKSLFREKVVDLAKKIAEEQKLQPKAVISAEREFINGEYEYDVFICHASEDKEDCVNRLATALKEEGVKVWYDEFSLKLGDKLRKKIDEGLNSSRYGVVVLSPNFFKKEWPQDELEGLLAIEKRGKKVILPIWHNLTLEKVAKYSPLLAGRLAAKTEDGIGSVVERIIEVIHE